MRVGTVAGLWRYPVKSMAGEPLAAATLTSRGIPGDRGWAVFDETRGGITGAKRLPALRACRVRYPSEPVAGDVPPEVEIALPDGVRVRSGTAEAAGRLSEMLGRPVTLRSLGPVGTEAAPRVSGQGESPEAIRAMMGLLPGEPDADMSAFPPERLRLMRQGTFFDALPLHLLTRTTLSTLAALVPDSTWDERRFRPNLVVDSVASDGYPEQAWIGRRLAAGTALIEVVAACPRCVMVTQPVDELPQDPRVMRTLVRETHHLAGVYARVTTEGDVRPGDELRLVE
jgi:uncharacterized protein YcbX